MKKRLLSVLLTLTMVVSLFPGMATTAYAADNAWDYPVMHVTKREADPPPVDESDYPYQTARAGGIDGLFNSANSGNISNQFGGAYTAIYGLVRAELDNAKVQELTKNAAVVITMAQPLTIQGNPGVQVAPLGDYVTSKLVLKGAEYGGSFTTKGSGAVQGVTLSAQRSGNATQRAILILNNLSYSTHTVRSDGSAYGIYSQGGDIYLSGNTNIWSGYSLEFNSDASKGTDIYLGYNNRTAPELYAHDMNGENPLSAEGDFIDIELQDGKYSDGDVIVRGVTKQNASRFVLDEKHQAEHKLVRSGTDLILRPLNYPEYIDINTTIIELDETVFTYDGEEHRPTITVTDSEGTTLEEGVHYTLKYVPEDCTNAGEKTVIIEGIDEYGGTVEKTFTINPKILGTTDMVAAVDCVTKDGETTSLVNDSVTYGDISLDYETPAVVINGDKATVTFHITGNYSGSITVENVPVKTKLNADMFKIDTTDKDYTGIAIEPEVTLTQAGNGLTEGVDYRVRYEDNTDAGTGKIIIEGMGNYGGIITGEFTINPKVVELANVALDKTVYTYTGEKITPGVVVTIDGYNPVEGAENDYTVSYGENTDVVKNSTEEGIVTIKFDGNYEGTFTLNFDIQPLVLVENEAPIEGVTTNFAFVDDIFVGEIKYGNTVLVVDQDYTVDANVGDKSAVIKFIGNYDGDYEVTDVPSKTRLIESMFTIDTANKNYTGKEIKPEVKSDTLVENTDYTVTYTNNTDAGTATITIKGIGKYIGTIEKTFKITLTVKFDLNGAAGDAIADVTDIECGTTITAPTPAPTRDDYVFEGWYQSASGSGKWDFNSDTVTDNMTLYAKWTKVLNTVGGKVQNHDGTPVEGATVKRMKNGEQQGNDATTDTNGNYSFGSVPVGTYNIVVTKDDVTVTVLVNVTADTIAKTIILPEGDKTSTVVNATPGGLTAMVGGLDEIANDRQFTSTDKVEIKLTVTEPVSVDQDAADAIEEKAGEKTLDYVDLDLTKKVNDVEEPHFGDTNTTLLTIIIPFDTYNKHDFAVYRYHVAADGSAKAQVLTETAVDGEKIVVGTDTITIYAKKFSTYAIGYKVGEGTTTPTNPGYTGGGSYTPTYTVTVPKTENGKVTATPKTASNGSTVKITVTPDKGYELDNLTVTDKNGKAIAVTDLGNGTYSFKMPSSNVTVKATFCAVVEDGCPKDETCPIWPYTDASTTAWYHDGAHYCIENGLMSGLPGLLFAPNGTTTRAQIVTILWNLEGTPVENFTMSFTDVAADQWYTEAVRWAAANGVVLGLSEETFAPNAAITREQLVTILRNYAQYKEIDVSVGEETNILSYTDALSVSTWAIPAVQWACGSGVISGLPDGNALKLDPQGTATRAQVATMMMNFCENIVK